MNLWYQKGHLVVYFQKVFQVKMAHFGETIEERRVEET